MSPGETFQLAFVMDESNGPAFIDSTLSDISVYNARVQDAWYAATTTKTAVENFLGTSVTFNCIGSTQNTNAKDNAEMGSGASFKGVYKLEGTKIADGDPTHGLYGTAGNHGKYGTENNKLDINQNGEAASLLAGSFIWTGTQVSGAVDHGFGNSTDNTTAGQFSQQMKLPEWINDGVSSNDQHFSLYALSEVLTWPSLPSPPPPPPPVCMVNGVWDKYQKKSPYGRWNNTNTNHKLFPMTICQGPGGKIIRKQTKNLYINTAARMSKKQTYAFLIRNGIGPYTR